MPPGSLSSNSSRAGRVTPPLQLRFVLSVADGAELPASDAEVAVVGRSNVGKSSLINTLANRKDLAHTSNTPGRTQLLNLYELTGGGTVMDLPGYGYSAVSKTTRASWPQMIEGYLLGREHLVMVMVLVDGEIGPTKLDLNMLAWLDSHELPRTVIATKHDKVKASQRARRSAELAAACDVDSSEVVWVSAAKGTGIDGLRGQLRHWLTPSAIALTLGAVILAGRGAPVGVVGVAVS